MNLRAGIMFLCLFTGISTARSAAEVAHFDILLFGSKIGNLTASKETRPDGSVLYLLDSWSKGKILWITYENITHYQVVYKDGKLISSSFKEVQNGEVKRWTNISFDGKVYHVDASKGKSTFTEAPTFSIVSVYFNTMQNVTRMFYEAEGDFNNLQHPDPETWEFKSSDGNRNIYHYVNGRVQNMEFHVSLATVKMTRVN